MVFKSPKSIPSQSNSIIHNSSSCAGTNTNSTGRTTNTSSNTNTADTTYTASTSSTTITTNSISVTKKSTNMNSFLVKPKAAISQLIDCPTDLISIVNSMEVPNKEIDINQQEITALEKYFHMEFFEGRPTKTPDRYIKIRNFIVNAWKESKPMYISKTAVRHGLKHCGDVNCISRIHSLLEQTGAINFGCEQLTYVRPLNELLEWFAQSVRSNKQSNITAIVSNVLERRPRTKTIAPKSHVTHNLSSNARSSREQNIDANYTVSHDDGTIILPNFKTKCLEDDSSDDETNCSRTEIKPELQLIQCLRYDSRDKGGIAMAPFTVSITLSTLLCLQLHSLSSKHEVMGFLGGHQTKVGTAQMKLHLTRYKPCQTSVQSSTMCEMCPGTSINYLKKNSFFIFKSVLFFSSISNGTGCQFN